MSGRDRAAMTLESMPPDRKEPTSTSLIWWALTDSATTSRICLARCSRGMASGWKEKE